MNVPGDATDQMGLLGLLTYISQHHVVLTSTVFEMLFGTLSLLAMYWHPVHMH